MASCHNLPRTYHFELQMDKWGGVASGKLNEKSFCDIFFNELRFICHSATNAVTLLRYDAMDRSCIVSSSTVYAVEDDFFVACTTAYNGVHAMAVEINTTDAVLMSCIKKVNTWFQVLTFMVVKADIAYVMSVSALFCHQFDLRALESWR